MIDQRKNQETKVVILGLEKSTLNIVFRELYESGISKELRTNEDLSDWMDQGVFLSSMRQEIDLDKEISRLANLEQPVVFIGWGKRVSNKLDTLTTLGTNNLVLTHCSPRDQLYGKQKFVGNKHFLLANEYLIAHKLNPIKWDG